MKGDYKDQIKEKADSTTDTVPIFIMVLKGTTMFYASLLRSLRKFQSLRSIRQTPEADLPGERTWDDKEMIAIKGRQYVIFEGGRNVTEWLDYMLQTPEADLPGERTWDDKEMIAIKGRQYVIFEGGRNVTEWLDYMLQIWIKNFGNTLRLLPIYCLPVPFVTVHALSFRNLKEKEDKDQEKPVDYTAVIETAEQLYQDYKVQELYDYLVKFKDCTNDEVLWRLARATTDKGKVSTDAETKKSCMFEAFEYAKRALQVNENNFACHKWYAVLLDYTGEYEGTKARISNAFSVKKHFLRAIELNPNDATSIHSIGFWCFIFADMPWYTRQLAAALFATPPTSTYSEALYYFQLAEKVEANFYSMNLLMIGKTHLRMKNYSAAKGFLIQARDYPVVTPDDKKAHEEAIQLLNKIGVKS